MDVRIGSEAKGDCTAEVRPAADGGIEVETKSAELLGNGIRAIARETLSDLAADGVAICVAEYGALDYVIAARIEAAVRAADPDGTRILIPAVGRRGSERDRPRRSRLYAPGNQPRLLVGIELHGADCVLLDLEDSVPLSEKAAARILVKHLLAAVEFRGEVWVRINPLDADGREDVEEILIGRPHGVCLPKAESVQDVLELCEVLSRVEADRGIDDGATWIMPILETAKGVLHSEEIAAASDRVVMLAFGAEDYTRDVDARRTSDALLFARSRIVAGAAAAGVQASDTVYADVDDEAGLIEEAQRARDLGFAGKGAINPRQIDPIHRAFSPTAVEIERARAIVEAARDAEAEGLGAVALDGRMIDRPVLDRAIRLIRYADKLAGGGGRDA
jgi:citrate lyase subunit beta/citryl-CoA lyase